MKKMRLGFSDTFGTAISWFAETFRTRYAVEICAPEDCDYLIFGDPNFGQEHYKYRNCKKILYTGENFRPNYFTYDHAISFDCENSPKHYRLPLWVLELDSYINDDGFNMYMRSKLKINRDSYMDIHTVIDSLQLYNGNRQAPPSYWCSFVQKNPNNPIRNQFVKQVSKHKEVACGGPLMNNIGRVIPRDIENKLLFIENYKFNIAFENGIFPGYETEKILDGYFAGVVPVYFGSTIIERDFNTNRFINVHDYTTMDEVVEKMKSLENTMTYMDMLCEPLFKDDLMPHCANKDLFLDWWETFVE